MIFINKLINNISELYNLTDEKRLDNLCDYDIPHINLHGPDGSMKKFYAYYIINKLNNININTQEFNIQEQNILIKNNNVNFKFINHKYFKEINLYHKLANQKHILKNYIMAIIQNKSICSKKHIFIINDFDKLKYNSYMLLRRAMEIFNKNVIFIFISNNLSKIPDAIKSRCLNIRCSILNNKALNKITKQLTIDYDIEKKEITKLIKSNEGDIYKILLNLENIVKKDIDNTDIDDTDIDNTDIDNIDIDNTDIDNIDINKSKINSYQNILTNEIIAHLIFIKKEKNPFKVLPKNREFIFKLITFNFDNHIILENFLKIIIKKYSKNIPINKIIQLTAKIDNDILNSTREIYHYEYYLLKIYKMFHQPLIDINTNKLSTFLIN